MFQVAAKLGVPCEAVQNVTIWGNHSSTQFPDVVHAKATVGGNQVPVYDAVKDDNFLKNEFISTVQQRGGAVIKARKLSSAMSAAKAIGDHMRDWFVGTKPVSKHTPFWVASYILLQSNCCLGIPPTHRFIFKFIHASSAHWLLHDSAGPVSFLSDSDGHF